MEKVLEFEELKSTNPDNSPDGHVQRHLQV